MENKETKKLWIIGDSFTGISEYSWTRICCNNFIGDRYYVSSKGSRDAQTILDILLRNLYKIEPNDLVILMLPTSERVRLPLKTPSSDIEYTNENIVRESPENPHIDFFIGTHQYDVLDLSKELELPLTGINENDFHSSNFQFNAFLGKIVNASNANLNNFAEILNSLKKFVYFELDIYSWTNEYKTPVIGKHQIETELSFWESLHDLAISTNGLEGKEWDFHWSPKTHKAFADYIMKKHSKYFI